MNIQELDCVLFNDGKEGVLLEIFDDKNGLFDIPIEAEDPSQTEPETRSFNDIIRITCRNRKY